jgi:hypothetical protein
MTANQAMPPPQPAAPTVCAAFYTSHPLVQQCRTCRNFTGTTETHRRTGTCAQYAPTLAALITKALAPENPTP